MIRLAIKLFFAKLTHRCLFDVVMAPMQQMVQGLIKVATIEMENAAAMNATADDLRAAATEAEAEAVKAGAMADRLRKCLEV